MTNTIQIEGLIEVLKGIADKVESNPSGSHLTADVEGEQSGDEIIAVLNNAAKKTPLTNCEVDFTYTVDGTPSVADPSIINLIGNELGLVMVDVDDEEPYKMYHINLGHPTELDTAEDIASGHIDVVNGVVTITHVRRVLNPVYEEWHKDGGNDGSYYFNLSTIKPNSEFVCNMGEWVASASYAADKVTTDSDTVNLWLLPSGTTLDDWKQFLSTHRVEIVYELDTPIVYNIDPTIIKTLNCYNNVVIAYQAQVTALNVTYIRDESKAIEALEQGGGSGGRTIELIVGDMTATYTTSIPTYVLPTVNTALPDGKHWTDYDEIIIVSITQQTPSSNSPQLYEYKSIPVWALSHCVGDYGVTVTTHASYSAGASTGTRICIFPDDKFRNDWYNYAAPIAILGVKY